MIATTTDRVDTRERILSEAARLFAVRGFRGTSIDDLGQACGMSGPAVYKHFGSKDEVLAELLIRISEHLRDGGRAVVSSSESGRIALERLIDFHLDFTTHEPDLIRVQDRDLANLSLDAAHRVRSLQRSYVETWVRALCVVRADLTPAQARVEAHAVFGLMNSTPHITTRADIRVRLGQMARRSLQLPQ